MSKNLLIFLRSSVIFEEALESLLFLRDTTPWSHKCTIAPSSENRLEDIFPNLFSAASTEDEPCSANSSVTTMLPEHADLLDQFEEKMELADNIESPAEVCTEVSDDREPITLVLMRVNKGKWVQIGQRTVNFSQKQSNEENCSQCVAAKREHARAKKNPIMQSEQTPAKSKARSGRFKKRKASVLKLAGAQLHSSTPSGSSESADSMEWQESISKLLDNSSDIVMETSTGPLPELNVGDLSMSGVDFCTPPESSLDMDELLGAWEVDDDDVLLVWLIDVHNFLSQNKNWLKF